MTVSDLLTTLQQRGVTLSIADGQLQVSGVTEAITPELWQELQKQREEVRVALSSAPSSVQQEKAISPLPAALRPYLGRWLFPGEAAIARRIAAKHGVKLQWERWEPGA